MYTYKQQILSTQLICIVINLVYDNMLQPMWSSSGYKNHKLQFEWPGDDQQCSKHVTII
jgi:hypothetical protein